MDEILTGTKLGAKPRVTAEEMTRRREAVRWAASHNRIEGLARSPEAELIYEAFVSGEIEFDDILPRLNALHHRL